ncbi:hypothetical protein Dimus_015131 [Dionaea muscipula]
MQDERPIAEVLSNPIILSDLILKTVPESTSFKFECSEVGKQVERLATMLRSAVRFATSPTTGTAFYDRPARRIAANASETLFHALTLVRKCRRRRRRYFFLRVVKFVKAADFRKLLSLIDASIVDLRWLLTLFDPSIDGDGAPGIVATIPPSASLNPMLSWVWSSIASVQMGQLPLQIEAANLLASLALDNDHNKEMMVNEGVIPPLLKLLSQSSSPDAQTAASTALYNLASSSVSVRAAMDHLGAPLIVQALSNSPMRVQIQVANLIARMAQHEPLAKEIFAGENVVGTLVSLLSFEASSSGEDDHRRLQLGKQKSIIDSVGRENMETKETNYRRRPRLLSPLPSFYYSAEGSSRAGGLLRKERENESPEVKQQLKLACAKALMMLAKDNVRNSRTVTETKGLLCLARLMKTEQEELQRSCLLVVMEITAAAESDADLRRAAFKSNSPAAKAVVEQLLVIMATKEEDPSLQIPAIRSIGSLARTFPARETRVIHQLVALLDDHNEQLLDQQAAVSMEAVVALWKFASPENFLCREHSKTIVECKGVSLLIKLLRLSENHVNDHRAQEAQQVQVQVQVQVLTLLCHLAIHAGSNEAFEQARVLTTLEGADCAPVALHYPQLKQLIPKAMNRLNMYHAG